MSALATAERIGVTEQPTWITGASRPLAARIFSPAAGEARGGVLLCPALGWDRTTAYLAMRALASALAEGGLLVLQVDYDGTGDSWGDDSDPDRLGAWARSVRAGADWLRAAGMADISVVGLRFGATLATSTPGCDFSRAVLWDPVPLGSRYARELRALQVMHGHPADSDGLTAAGADFSAETVAAIRTFDIRAPDMPTLVLQRPAAPSVPLFENSPLTEVVPAPGQQQLLDGDSVSARIPADSVALIAAWLNSRAPMSWQPIVRGATDASVSVGGLEETFVSPGGLAGITTAPSTGTVAGLPTMVFVSNAIEPRSGPGRAWVTWARALATHGFQSLRVDLSGVGDSPDPAGVTRVQNPFAPYVIDDLATLAQAMDAGSGVVLIGLCSGARNAIDLVAARHPDGVRGLVLINAAVNERRRVVESVWRDDPTPAGLRRADVYHQMRLRMARAVGPTVWRWLQRRRFLPDRTTGIRAALAADLDVLLLYAKADYGLPKLDLVSHEALAAMGSDRHFDMAIVSESDHALWAPLGRRAMLSQLTTWAVDRYGSPSGPA